MVTRLELNEKTHSEIQATLQQDLDLYKISVDEISEVSELEQLESDLMKEHDEFQLVLKQTNYKLQESVDFEGGNYKKSVVAENIAYFLNKQEVEWSYTLGLYQLVKLWRNVGEEIPYDAYDSTLRLLNQTKFKGFNEWRDILVANEYLSICHLEYVRDTSYLIYLAQKHNIIMDRMKLVSPDAVPDTEA